MSGKSFNGALNIKKAFIGDNALKKAFVGELNVYSSGYIVYYHIDRNNIIAWEVEDGADCIANAPQVSVPGYSLHGWRNDTVASSSVISSKTCDREGIVLYAVLKQTVTASYNGNGSTGGTTSSTSGIRYYNNGNAANPTVRLANNGYTRTNYIFSQWAMGSPSGTRYNVGANITLSANTTFYAYWIATSTINKTFSFTGTIQSYTAPVAGTYTLETWGAQGGGNTQSWETVAKGGLGGYAKGNVRLALNQTIYVIVGGMGSFGKQALDGGYNGGGSSGGHSDGMAFEGGSGGGATHIGKQNAILSGTSQANLFIVAGGGGGGGAYYDGGGSRVDAPSGGTGGGTNGGNGDGASQTFEVAGLGGLQTQRSVPSGVAPEQVGSYGQGGGRASWHTTGGSSCGGGGGYYGGNTGYWEHAGGGGGSGYIGGCISGTTSMSNGVREGNGYAKITYISA